MSVDTNSTEFRAGDAAGYRLAEVAVERIHALDDKRTVRLCARTVRENCKTAAAELGFPEADHVILTALAAVLILDPKGEL